MLSRALSLAAAMLLIGFAAPASIVTPASAQNLEAGKSPPQLFSANCSVCHKSARGLLKGVTPADLPGFLRQHYTTSADMAKSLSGYVIANGAGGGRNANDDGLTRRGRELSREQPPVPGDAAAEPAPRHGRKSKRLAPAQATAPAGEAPAAAESEAPAPKAKGRKGNRLHPAPKSEAKPETDNTEPAKPAEASKPAEAAKPETPPATRADPVPAVTPAPKEAAPKEAAPEPTKPDAQ